MAREIGHDFPAARDRVYDPCRGGAVEKSLERLTGAQLEQLTGALVSAFPDHAALARMVRFRLERNLNAIAAGGSLLDTAFELVTAAEAEGWVRELVTAARAGNPGNPQLRAVAEGLGSTGEAPPEATPSRDPSRGRTVAGPRRLTHSEVLSVHEAAVQVGLFKSRDALLGGIDRGYTGMLALHASASEQLLSDLGDMNRTPSLADGSDPLQIWLANAAHLTSSRRESAVFSGALEKITGRKPG